MSLETSTGTRDGTVRPDRIERPAALPTVRAAVPWKTVAALAVVLSFADGIWLTSLRGAVGAIERTQSPFLSWLQESTVLLPVFAVGVLGALMLAKRWFGPELSRPRTVVAAVLLVAVVGTIIALAVSAASSVYDYRLQSHLMQMMDAMRSRCVGSCLAGEQHATLALHVRSLVYISRWLLLTNVVLVAWLVAMWGGRLRLRATGRVSGSSRDRDLRLLLVGALVAAAAVHAAVVPGHLSEWPAAGMFFILLTIWELAVAGLLLVRLEERTMLLAAAAVSLAPLALWLLSRTAGLPFGPEPGTAEGIGLPDLAAGVLEVVSLLAALTLLRPPGRPRRPATSAHARSLVVLALLAVTLIGVAAVGLHWFDAFGVADARSATDIAHSH